MKIYKWNGPVKNYDMLNYILLIVSVWLAKEPIAEFINWCNSVIKDIKLLEVLDVSVGDCNVSVGDCDGPGAEGDGPDTEVVWLGGVKSSAFCTVPGPLARDCISEVTICWKAASENNGLGTAGGIKPCKIGTGSELSDGSSSKLNALAPRGSDKYLRLGGHIFKCE